MITTSIWTYVRKSIAALSVVALGVGIFGNAAQAIADRLDRERHFEIPAQPLATALVQFSKQAEMQLVTSSIDVGSRETRGISGQVSIRRALESLLDRTGLTFSLVGENTVAIVQEGTPRRKIAENVSSAIEGPASIRLAQADDAYRSNSTRGEGESSESPEDEVAHDEGNEKTAPLAEIVVTGSRIAGVEVASPMVTIGRQEITRSGYSNLPQLFESLPQNFDGLSPETFNDVGTSRLAVSNAERASGIDLRGLGPDATLTLLNGVRLAGAVSGRVVDVSTIPLSIIERVEVVTGGRSAIYGSDAVGGVVNLVTVTGRNFDGPQTRVVTGYSPRGGERAQASQTLGLKGNHAGFILAYDYARQRNLDLADTPSLNSPDPLGRLLRHNDVIPDSETHALFGSGYVDIGAADLHLDAYYSSRDTLIHANLLWPGASQDTVINDQNKSENYNFASGISIPLSPSWTLDATTSLGRATFDGDSDFLTSQRTLTFTGTSIRENTVDLSTLAVTATGHLPPIGVISPRLAIGGEYRWDELSAFSSTVITGGINSTSVSDSDQDRTISSAFMEVALPLAADDRRVGLYRFDISLAARRDHYSDFGGTTNPQFGIVYQPVRALAIKGMYSSAFRAPALAELNPTTSFLLENINDPASGGPRPVLVQRGGRDDLGPEEADTWSIGFDLEPLATRRLTLSAYYFDINFRGRIDAPATTGVDRQNALLMSDAFADIINRSPTATDVNAVILAPSSTFSGNTTGTSWNPATQSLLSVFPNLAILDTRIANHSREQVRGVDLSVDAGFPSRTGTVYLGLNGTYTLEHDRQLVEGSPPFAMIDQVGKPTGLKLRGKLGWQAGAYGAYAYVNYCDEYPNQFRTPDELVESWTTVDLSLSFDGADLKSGGFAEGFGVNLSVRNLFNTPPPEAIAGNNTKRYDSANGSPIGRYFTLSLSKHW